MRWASSCIVMVLLISAAGCYYYEPLETPAPQPGTYK